MKRILAAIPAIFGAILILIILKQKPKETINYIGLASIKKPVYIYHGPSQRSKRAWKLLHKNWPIFIITQSKNWLKITDAYGTLGWIEKHNISHPRALVKEDTYITDLKGNKVEILLLKNTSIKFICEKKEHCIIEIDNKQYLINSEKIWYKI